MSFYCTYKRNPLLAVLSVTAFIAKLTTALNGTVINHTGLVCSHVFINMILATDMTYSTEGASSNFIH